MKKIIINIFSIFTLLLMVNCQEDNFAFGSLSTPTGLKVSYEIKGKTVDAPNGDGSGKVTFNVTADNAISYRFVFPDGTTENAPSGSFTKTFTKTGVNTYTVVILASGKAGVTTTTTVDVEVLSNFKDDEAIQFLTGGASKKWYWAKDEIAHLGVGQNTAEQIDGNGNLNYYPTYYATQANEKSTTCLYNSVMTFSLVQGQIKFNLDNKGETYYNGAIKGGDDNCYPLDTKGDKVVTLSPSESFVTMNPDHATQTRGTQLNFSNDGFMGYFFGASAYEILSITENRMVVRGVMPGNTSLAWYHIFTTTPPSQATPVADYTKLVFSDEFNTNGAPDPTKWGYDLGAGGWGNSEEQTYTNSANNVVVQDGSLKITAKKEGATYTSARLKSEDKFEFTYGKVEIKAKLTTGAGTWPAIWMLGQDYATNTWPGCGEIDIMEYKGSQPTTIYGTLHYPGRSGGNGNGNSTSISNAASEFHVYKTIWSPSSVKIYVDDKLFHSVTNDSSLPFNKDLFLILNVAMGGTFGGAIDSAFSQSSMEIDYVRVYQ
ncbi:family 16 glycosylhydrolase [Flavobacterium frigoris]|uniref:Laminarinase n=1 Tax=Flavobacterium frigoris (strain PS1) TaxID=1086011 RepID=H7FTR3_FLAFP|nr:glycoside hydrolase family 16 protein [Flavobacterium frigoris]EIA08054.1 laminarinase [Flavobacterium frigoris PS1]